MDPQALELSKSSARSSVTYAGGAAAAYFLIGLLSKIPIVGLLFFCINGLLVLAAYFAIAYFVTPRLTFPAGQTKGMLSLWAGLGVSVVTTAAFLVPVIILGILGILIGAGLGGSDNAFGSAVGGTLGLIIQIIGFIVGGLLVGTLISFLGSYLAFDKNQNVQSATRPF